MFTEREKRQAQRIIGKVAQMRHRYEEVQTKLELARTTEAPLDWEDIAGLLDAAILEAVVARDLANNGNAEYGGLEDEKFLEG